MKIIACEPNTRTLIVPNRKPIHEEYARFEKIIVEDGELVTKYDYKQYNEPLPLSEQLTSAKLEAEDKIKAEAGERISALDWMVQRAERHLVLNKSGKKTLTQSLQLQQNIEEASDAAEIAVNLLTTVEEVWEFTW